jgi:hypothetical protein
MRKGFSLTAPPVFCMTPILGGCSFDRDILYVIKLFKVLWKLEFKILNFF